MSDRSSSRTTTSRTRTAMPTTSPTWRARTIILDDDNNDQNDAVSGPAANEAYAYPSGGLSLENDCAPVTPSRGSPGCSTGASTGSTRPTPHRRTPTMRGDCVRWPPRRTTFERTNARPAEVEDVGGRIKVAAFNVLNYFTTHRRTSSSSSGPCGPSGTLDCRGADSEAELARQRAKEIVAIGALDADVVGLVELQNDDGTAVRDLVAGPQRPSRRGALHRAGDGTDRYRRHQGHVHLPGRRR